MPDWAWWLVASGGLALLEVLVPAFVFLMLAVGALAGAGVAALGGGVVLQVLAFAATSVLMLGFVRPSVRRVLLPPETKSGAAALVGGHAIVLVQVDGRGGRVRIGGEEWSARALDPGEVLPPGIEVTVVEIDGATAVVWSGG